MHVRLTAASMLVLCSLWVPRAHAGPADDRAAAEGLFRDGRALIKQDKPAEACPKFEASYKLDPTAGTLLALGDCYERVGQTASAWATFTEVGSVARKANDDMRAEEAVRRASLLEPHLPKLVIEVDPLNRGLDLIVRRNDKRVDTMILGSSIPVDPGEHTIEATAPGKQPWIAKVQIEAKPGLTTVRVPQLSDSPKQDPIGVSTAKPVKNQRINVTEREGTSLSTLQIMGIAIGGVGLAGVAVGAVYGAKALSNVNEASERNHCTKNEPPRCNQIGYDLHHKANAAANVANVTFAVGITSLVTGTLVFVAASSREHERPGTVRFKLEPSFGSRSTGVLLSGGW